MKDKSKGIGYDYECFDPEYIKQILLMYLTGVPVLSISMYMGMSGDEINRILDYYTPYL